MRIFATKLSRPTSAGANILLGKRFLKMQILFKKFLTYLGEEFMDPEKDPGEVSNFMVVYLPLPFTAPWSDYFSNL